MLDDLDLIGLMIDGVEVARQTVVALGITSDGTKVPLGLAQGSTENGALCTSLLQGLLSRGLKVEDKHAPTRRVGWDRIFWEQHTCFADVLPDGRHLESTRLEGTVFTSGYSAASYPVAGAVIYARRPPAGEVLTAETDQDGRFALPDTPEGVYELGVCANGWTPWRGTVRIAPEGPPDALELPLEEGT